MLKENLTTNWKEIYNQIDLNGDGKVDQDEFMAAAIDYQKITSKKNIKKIF